MDFIRGGKITFYCDIVFMDNKERHHYKFGIFYHHKDNPKIWVPKADGLGWTLNFANKWSYVILFGILGFAAVCILLSMNQKS